MNLTKRALFVGAVAVGVSSATEALGNPPQELPDYIRIDARDAIEFGLRNIEFKINKMEQDACIQFSYEFEDDLYHSYTLVHADIVDMIEEQHPELEITMIDDDGINEEVRLWISVRPGKTFETIPFDPGPFASEQRKNLTIKLPSEKRYESP